MDIVRRDYPELLVTLHATLDKLDGHVIALRELILECRELYLRLSGKVRDDR